jgi:hypothetical protein
MIAWLHPDLRVYRELILGRPTAKDQKPRCAQKRLGKRARFTQPVDQSRGLAA